MGTPTWFHFAAVQSTPAQLFSRVESLRREHRFKPRDMARLSRNTESGELEFQESTLRQVHEDAEVLDAARTWDGFAVAYNVLSIQATMYLHFWRQDRGAGFAVEVDTQVPYREAPGMAEGEWLERFMCAYAATCDSSACAYGRDWPFSFESLEPARLVEELRGGKLLKRPLPGFYLLSPSLLSGEEVSSLLHAQEAELAKHHHLLRYFRTSTGHHVLSSLCRSDWWAA